MSRKQWKRLEIAERVIQSQMTQLEASRALGLSERQVRRLCVMVREKGARAVIHGNRGRAPHNRLGPDVRETVLSFATGKYAGFNDHHLAEKLADAEGLEISRASVQRILREAKVASPRKRRPRRYYRRRERKAQEGAMLLWDGSRHDWLERRGPRLCLMGAVDDATGALMPGAHFVMHESTTAYLTVLRAICASKGAPLAIYMDRHSALKRNDSHWTLEEELKGAQHKTQVGRALEELAIEAIFALSPQAKGRVERLWGTLQDRLVSELRLAGAYDIASANKVLAAYSLEYNRRFARPATDKVLAWRKVLLAEANRACALAYKVRVTNDNRIIHAAGEVELAPGPASRSHAGTRVELRHFLDGTLHVYREGKALRATTCSITLPPVYSAPKTREPKPPSARSASKPKKKLTFAQIKAKYTPMTQTVNS